jgi:hypothetical protein
MAKRQGRVDLARVNSAVARLELPPAKPYAAFCADAYSQFLHRHPERGGTGAAAVTGAVVAR